jgi:NAD(P)-dependent dehydrogenase (short-subunit alcohol dehydrogenase family)
MSQNAPVGDLTGRIVVVTGASSGIGLAASTNMAQRGAHLVMIGRDPRRLSAAVESVRVATGGRAPVAYRADFARLDDVHVLVDHLRQRYQRIDVLANNAGGVIRGKSTTSDGLEATIQTNHLAAFLLSNLLREQLRGGRIINTSSDAHKFGALNPDDLRGAVHPGAWRAYGSAKQANILFTIEATRRWPDILSTSYHPGVVRTRFGAGFGFNSLTKLAPWLKSPAQGADTMIWLASTPAPQIVPGAYYVKRKVRTPSPHATNAITAQRLWETSLEAVGLAWR